MTPIILASPYAGDRQRNLAYAHDCMLHSIKLGEAPLASHLLYPQILNDDIEEERALGIECEWRWLDLCKEIVVYDDLGVSRGMSLALERAQNLGYKWTFRRLNGLWLPEGAKQ